ncbi:MULTISPECIES: DUF1214 domain-containing protein [unclassified Flavobacterium]|uniref:DUF1214 domain-containing protein n=1 Tax=unclassified Flavobacterium TaxID=196869 RepID=UPI001066A8DE|nr:MULTISPECIES: DUF1214 domain-containing protein [unclassified Flavobacterium]MDQ1166797.1 hypothetical protein [Flavobacterium sp. SORGH_AS_0622]TDX12550.1 hypothetical protein EDB96_1617 [Flavobacterium sp. S87F.05.LMB.W.Kidney.N]
MALNQKIKKIAIGLGLILLAVVLGSGIGIYNIKSGKSDSQRKIGNWQTVDKDKDLNTADLLTIAQVAVYGPYALTKKEVIYLSTNTDSEGNALDPKSDYVINGKKLDAKYWSITAYDENGFLIKNPINKYGYNLEDVKYEADSTSYKINLSGTEKKENWLPINNVQKTSLIIRLYLPSEKLRENLTVETLPTIQKVK